MHLLLIAWLSLGATTAHAECEDTAVVLDSGISVGEEDCDGDGWTKGGGGVEADRDCDDEKASVNPGQEIDRCDDSYDNDCDGYYNEGCEQGYQRGSLIGGSSCSVVAPTMMWLFVVPLFGIGRYRC